MNKKILVIVIICLCLAVVGIAAGIAVGGGAGGKILLESDASKHFNLKEGDTFTIKLGENLSTGYSWHYKIIDVKVINLQSGEVKVLPASNGATGVPSEHIWNFRAVAKGTASIKFTYEREWDKSQLDKTCEYTFTVK